MSELTVAMIGAVMLAVGFGAGAHIAGEDAPAQTDAKHRFWIRENVDEAREPLICSTSGDGMEKTCVRPIEDPLGPAIEALRQSPAGEVSAGGSGLPCVVGPSSAPVCDEDGDGYVSIGDVVVDDRVDK